MTIEIAILKVPGNRESISHNDFPHKRMISANMGESQTQKNSVSAYGWGGEPRRIKHPILSLLFTPQI